MKLDLPTAADLLGWADASDEVVLRLKESVLRELSSPFDGNPKGLVPEFSSVRDASEIRLSVKEFLLRPVRDGKLDPPGSTLGWNLRAFLPGGCHSRDCWKIRCLRDGKVVLATRVSPLDLGSVRAQNQLATFPVGLPEQGTVLSKSGNRFCLEWVGDEGLSVEVQFRRTGTPETLESGEDDGADEEEAKAQTEFENSWDRGMVLWDRSTAEKTYLLLARDWYGTDLYVAELDTTRPTEPVLTVGFDHRGWDDPVLEAVRATSRGRVEIFLNRDNVLETELFRDAESMGDPRVCQTSFEDAGTSSGWYALSWVDRVCLEYFNRPGTCDAKWDSSKENVSLTVRNERS